MAVNIGPRIGIDGEAEYRKQIQNIIQETKTLKSEYQKMQSAMDQSGNSLKKNAELHKQLEQQIEKQKERVQKLSEMVKASADKYGEADAKTLKWKEALNNAEAELNNLNNKLKELPSNLKLVGDAMQSMGDKISSIGQGIKDMGSALRPLSTAATAVIAGSVKTFADFESQMSRVKAISGATGDEFQALSDKAREMGATTKYTATESGEAFEYMAMAGWKADQMLEGIAPVMNLAAASGEELGTVSDIVTDALTAFGLEAQDTAEFTDVLAAAATNANTNVGMMGESFKYAAPVAGSLGYSVQDVALALGLMANNGIKADMAGTSLRNMIQRMAKPTKESAEAMERLGVDLYDDEGKMYSLRQIMDQLRKSFGQINMPIDEFNQRVEDLNTALEDGSISEKEYGDELIELSKQAYGAEGAEKARAAAMLAGARAMPALLSIVNTAEKDYRQLASSIDNSAGAAQEMADTMIDNTAGALTIMKSAVEGAGIELGEVFAPYVTKAAKGVQDLAVKFSNLSQAEQENIAKNIALAAAAAPVLTAVGSLTKGIGDLISVAGKFTSWIGSLGAAGGPLALVAAGALAAAGAIAALQVAVENVRTERLNNALSKAFKNEDGVPVESILSGVTDKINDMAGSFDMISQKSVELDRAKENVINLTSEIDKIKTSLDAGVTTAEEAAPELEQLLGQLADAISSKMSAAADVLLATFGDGGFVSQAFEKTGNTAESMREKIVQSMDEQQRKVYELQKTMSEADFGSEQYWKAYQELLQLNAGTDEFEENVKGFKDYVDGNPIDWSKYFDGDNFNTESFRNDLQETLNKADEFKNNMQTAMKESYDAADQLNDPNLSESIRTALPFAFQSAMGDIAATSVEATDAIQNELIGGINEQIKQAEDDWSKMNLLEKIVIWDGDKGGYIKSQVGKYKTDVIDPISKDIETSMQTLGVEGAGWASEASLEIIKGLFDTPTTSEYANGAKTTLKSDWESILDDVGTSLKGVAEERGGDIVDGFSEGINNNAAESATAAQKWMETIKNAIHDSVMKFGSPSKTTMEFGKDTVDGFDQGVTKEQPASTRTVNSWMSSIQTGISSKIPGIVSQFGTMQKGINSDMSSITSSISSAMSKIKSILNTRLEFPKIKMPHFRITGEFSLNPPKVPSIDVDWYAKAMQGGMRLDGATIFGAAGNKLLGGGEVGPEWVIGEGSLMSMIQSAVSSATVRGDVVIGDTTIVINAAEGQDVYEIAEAVDEIINARYQQAEAAWA